MSTKTKLNIKFSQLTIPLSVDSNVSIKKNEVIKLTMKNIKKNSKLAIFCKSKGDQYTENGKDHVVVEEMKKVSDDKVDHEFKI